MLIAWAYAEVRLFATFARVSGVGLNMAMESYYRIPTFDSRVKFILALIEEWDAPAQYAKDEIATAVTKLGKMAEVRNSWVHGDWCTDEKKTETVIFNHRVPIASDKRRKPVKARAIEDHSNSVLKRARELGTLIRSDELDA